MSDNFDLKLIGWMSGFLPSTEVDKVADSLEQSPTELLRLIGSFSLDIRLQMQPKY
ncbi:MAG: hypothetical protein IPP63_08290 [Chloracidobacterium sp.]|nr:hypothetical protein [Chloracidobacterium sp.]